MIQFEVKRELIKENEGEENDDLEVVNVIDKHRVTVEIVMTDNLPDEILLFRQDLQGVEIYSGICSITNLNEFDTQPSEGTPFYRKSIVVRDFNSNDDLETFVRDVVDRCSKLDRDYYNTVIDGNYATDDDDNLETIITNIEDAV